MNKKLSEMSNDELWHLFPIKLCPPSDKWVVYYLEMKEKLLKLLNKYHHTIHHVGSTAINGIWAKPIIDIAIEFDSVLDMNEASDILVNDGFRFIFNEDNRIYLNKGYGENGIEEKVYHIHIRLNGDNDEVIFKDYLNKHYDLAKEYEKLKLELWKRFEFDRDGYTQAKSDFILNVLSMAKENRD